jgi:GcrA cell cycle regulator
MHGEGRGCGSRPYACCEGRLSMWTEERVHELERLWVDHSASQIAEVLGVTRNAVIGKLHRLGMGSDAAPREPGMPWPDEATTILLDMWRAHSHAETARALAAKGYPYSRLAVAKKGSRLGLPSKKTGPRGGPRKPPRPRQRHYKLGFGGRFQSPVPLKPKVAREPPKPPEMLMLGILDLKPANCRFPIGDPRDAGFGFCGSGREGGRPYCPYHMVIAYRPPEKRRVKGQANSL